MRNFTLGLTALLVLSFSSEIKAIAISSANGGGSWNVSGSWSPAQVPTIADDVTITVGNNISLGAPYGYARSLTIDVGATLTKSTTLNIATNLTVNGSFVGLGNINFSGVGIISGSSTISVPGHFVIGGNTTINAGTIINKPGGILLAVGATLTNSGNVTLYNDRLDYPAGSTFTNAAGATMSVASNSINFGGTFDCSAVPNTFVYNGTLATQVRPATTAYNNISFTGGGTKLLMANISVTGTTTINASTFLNGNGFTFTTSGNWVNNVGSTNLTNVDMIFTSSATQTIFKPATETFRHVTCSGTGTILFNTHVTLTGNLTINSGTVDVNTYPYLFFVGGNWQNNGGVFNPRTGTVRFQGTGANTFNRLVGIELFYNIQKMNVGTLTLTSSISVTRDLTIGAGTLACSGAQFIFLQRNWVNSGGTFSPATSTVFLQGSAAFNIGKTIAGTETFNNLTKATANVGTLTSSISCSGNLIHASGTIDVSASNYTISVAGNLTLNSTFTERSGRVIMNGAAAQTMSASIGQDLYNFEVNNSSTGVTNTSGTFRINNSYTPTLGNLATSGTGRFSFVSSSAAHAFTASGPGTYSGTGFTYQRFISSRAANWYDLATPVPSTILDWDNEIYMSGVGGSDGTACCPTFYSVTTWDEPSGVWTDVTSTGTPISTPVGYTIFLGDDLITWSGVSIIDVTGTPISGTQAIALSYTGASPDPGGNVIGNAQNSFIDWTTALAASPGVDGTFYLYDATGNYVPYGAGDQISPHQGFWVYATGAAQTMNLTQASKVASNSPTFLRTARIHDLSLKISTDAFPYSHEIHIDFDETATNGYDNGLDSRYVKSPLKVAPNLTMVHQGNLLLVKNVFAPIDAVVTIPVRSRVGADGTYTISANGAANIDEYTCVLLKDLFTGEVIDLRENPVYSFNAKISDDPDRFMLYMIREASACDEILKQTVSNEYFSENQVILLNDGKSASLQFDLDLNTPVQIHIYDAVGQLIRSEKMVVGHEIRNLELPATSGVYLVSIEVNGNTITKKAVINK